MKYFNNKVSIVTGGASGIGRALCIELAKLGSNVICADINFENVKTLVNQVIKDGGKASAYKMDVSKSDEFKKLADKVLREYGRIDFLFNNAGIAIAGEVKDMDLEQWQRIVSINLFGVINGINAVYPTMIKQGFGHIINTSSAAGLLCEPIATAYTTTKHAIVGLSTSLRPEAASHKVKVSVACPGYIDTDFYKASTVIDADYKEIVSSIPFKMMKADKAANRMLKGVKRNKSIIIFPFHARFFWLLYRLFPSLVIYSGKQFVNDYNKIRKKR